LELKTDYLSILSHELRNPLNSMINIIEMAFKSVDDTGKLTQYLEKLKHISHFMMSINDNLIGYCQSRHSRQTICCEEFNLSEFIDEVRALFEVQAELKSQRLEIVKDGLRARRLIGDTVKLKQVLINLLANANKYTPAGGVIRLMCAAEDRGKNALIRFTVRDNGIGMSPDFIKTMFLPYAQETTAHRDLGQGLGLYIVKEIVRANGGKIDVASEVGKGTAITVTLRLPVAQEDEADCALDLTGVNFLVADDCDINLEVIGDMIRRQGGAVETVRDGEEALNKYLAAPEHHYQMMIIDVRMPKLDGLTLARKIRSTRRADKDLPILAMSAGYYPSCRRRRKEVSEFINKPFAVKHFYRVVGQLLFSS
jgi:two-component system sensor histidine kinase/response regulator